MYIKGQQTESETYIEEYKKQVHEEKRQEAEKKLTERLNRIFWNGIEGKKAKSML